MKVIVSSQNPVKINATEKGFKKVFPEKEILTEGVNVNSDVPDQPQNEEETLQGATNRANNAYRKYPKADYWIGIESGIQFLDEEVLVFTWVYIKGKNKIGKSRSVSYVLPAKVSVLLKQELELGDALDILLNEKNIKQKNGAIGVLTSNILTREKIYITAIISALVPFVNKSLY